MNYDDLAFRLGVRFRPIERWPDPPNPDRRYSPFRASFGATMKVLARELEMLHAERIVLQIAVSEGDLRIDGMPRANVKAAHPGVILAFDSKWGPLQYATDEFQTWQDNLRAIALAMEALRKVDRYGVSKRGEQYKGWKAIPASTDPADAIQTREQARAVLDAYGSVKDAIRSTHPDTGGDETEFRKVQRARELLRA